MKRYFNEDTPEIKLGWIKKDTYGMYWFDTQVMAINIPLLITSTFLHELAHHKHPSWSEERVEDWVWNEIDRLRVEEIMEIASLVLQFGSR